MEPDRFVRTTTTADALPFPARVRWFPGHPDVYMLRDSTGRIWEGTDPVKLREKVRAIDWRRGKGA